MNRIVLIDIAKVITAFLVVFTHLYTKDDPFRLWIYSFHMPLFFYISELFHKVNNVIATIKINFRRLIVPAISFVLLGTIVYVIINGIDSLWICLFQSVKGIILGSKIPGNNVVWFLFALFWCNIFLNLVLRRKWILVVMTLLVLLYIITFLFNIRWLHLKQALFAFPFYIIGYISSRLGLLKQWEKFAYKDNVVALACIVGGGALLIFNFLISKLNPDTSMHFCNPGEMSSILKWPVFYLNGMLGTMGIIILSSPWKIDKGKQIIEKCSRGLISILGIQYLFMLLWDEFVGRNQPYWISAMTSVIIMYLCILLHQLFEKYIPFVVGKKKCKLI